MTRVRLIAFAVFLAASSTAGWLLLRPRPALDATIADAELEPPMRHFCGYCHAFPSPDSFPRRAWREEVEKGYGFFQQFGLSLDPPPLPAVVSWYERRAPEELPPADIRYSDSPCPVRIRKDAMPMHPRIDAPAVSHVEFVHLRDPKKTELLICDMKAGLVSALALDEPGAKWRVLGEVPNPARAFVVDLDGDGINDILVADLGSFPPTDRLVGSVVWLRGRPDGTYTKIVLLDKVARVADVRAAAFRGDPKKLDLVVAVFGLHEQGELLLLENHTTDRDHPKFEKKILDKRRGAIHVPIADLDGDGKLDFVVLFAQEHETIVAFLNNGDGTFRPETIYEAGDPSYGSSGIELVDLNGDGRPDVLYTNGDTLDKPYLLKPYHGVQWLENVGRFPFKHHPIGAMYGVHRALPIDIDGRKHVLAVAFLPEEGFPDRREKKLDAVVLFEQTSPGKFVRHSLEMGTCDHVSLTIDKINRDVVIGGYGSPAGTPPVRRLRLSK